MSVISTTEVWQGRTGQAELERYKRAFSRTFRVITSDPLDGQELVMAAPGISLGDAYLTSTEGDSGAICKSIDASQDQDYPLTWIVTVNYDSEYPDPSLQDPNPLTRAPVYSFGAQKYTIALQEDVLGDPFLNTAKQPFIPPIEVERARGTITVSKNIASFTSSDYQDLLDTLEKVNNDEWNGLAIGTVKVVGISVTPQSENGTNYHVRQFQLEYKAEGWNGYRILNSGYYTRNTTTGALTLIRDSFGQPLSSPALLNEDGDGVLDPDVDEPIYLEFDIYETMTFAGAIP